MTPYKILNLLFVLSCLYYQSSKSQSLTLQKGDSIIIEAKANKLMNHSGVRITKGETYLISATGKWQDAGFEPTDAEGFPSKNGAMRFARFLKPVPKENYLKLVAKVRSRHYPVGNMANIRFEKGGELIFQPNDAFFFYGNNSGSLKITIKRLE